MGLRFLIRERVENRTAEIKEYLEKYSFMSCGGCSNPFPVEDRRFVSLVLDLASMAAVGILTEREEDMYLESQLSYALPPDRGVSFYPLGEGCIEIRVTDCVLCKPEKWSFGSDCGGYT